jgi:hypothetical protein
MAADREPLAVGLGALGLSLCLSCDAVGRFGPPANLQSPIRNLQWVGRAELGRGVWCFSQLPQPANWNLAPAARDIPKLTEMGCLSLLFDQQDLPRRGRGRGSQEVDAGLGVQDAPAHCVEGDAGRKLPDA